MKDEVIAAFEALPIEDKMTVVKQIMPGFCMTVMQNEKLRQQMMSTCRDMMGGMNMAGPEMMQMMMEMMSNEQ